MATEIRIPVSVGELLDKISILEIKAERITHPARLENVRHELALLEKSRDALTVLTHPDLSKLAMELKAVNQKIWDAEDVIHGPEQDRLSEAVFLAQAHIAFEQNDLRAQIKRKINNIVGSTIVEEKSYSSF